MTVDKFTKYTGLVAFLTAYALFASFQSHAREPFTLDAVRAKVKQDYSQVPQLTTQGLAELVKQDTKLILLDVREKEEFSVSRIKGAERVDPGIWRWNFMRQFGNKVRGKTVVFYCSVGVRSSSLAENVLASLKAQGANAIYNLDGGVFAWHNEARTLVNDAGLTPHVHPFDEHWGRLVQRRKYLRTKPQ